MEPNSQFPVILLRVSCYQKSLLGRYLSKNFGHFSKKFIQISRSDVFLYQFVTRSSKTQVPSPGIDCSCSPFTSEYLWTKFWSKFQGRLIFELLQLESWDFHRILSLNLAGRFLSFSPTTLGGGIFHASEIVDFFLRTPLA